MWEQPLTFMWLGLLPDELEERPSRGPTPGPIFGQHAPVRLTLERLDEERARPVWTQDREHLGEQGYLTLPMWDVSEHS